MADVPDIDLYADDLGDDFHGVSLRTYLIIYSYRKNAMLIFCSSFTNNIFMYNYVHFLLLSHRSVWRGVFAV